MLYHILVEVDDLSVKNKISHLYEVNNEILDNINADILIPYSNEKRIYIDGRYVAYEKIRMLKVFKSEEKIADIVAKAQNNLSPGIFMIYTRRHVMNDKYMTNITKELLQSLKSSSVNISNNTVEENNVVDNKKVFLVHGREHSILDKVARFLTSIDLQPIILHEQANNGNTLIEKIEKNTDVGYGIILYTPCDVGGLSEDKLSPRARQNVIFEHGFLIGKLGRERVSALVKTNIEHPSDINGIGYIPYEDNNGWKLDLIKELKAAGYDIDMNKLC